MGKYWYENRTKAAKISPYWPRAMHRMNEEIKHIGDVLRDPGSFPFLNYWVILLMAMWGGVVRIIREVKLSDKTWRQIVAIFAAELVVSGFIGMMTLLLCEAAGFNQLYTGAMAGIAGCMGGRSLALLESIYRNNGRGPQ